MIVAVVLAGGRGLRLGGVDKPLLALEGDTLLGVLLSRLRGQVDAVALSANGDPARFAAFGLPVLADARQDRGPLAGVLQGLLWAGAQGAHTLLSVPGDTPFIPGDLVERLQPAPASASSAGAEHPLVALWPVAAAEALAAWPDPRVRSFAARIGMRSVAFEDETDPFLNVNTPAELAAARRRAGGD